MGIVGRDDPPTSALTVANAVNRDRRPAQRALTMWLLRCQGYSYRAIGRAYGISSQSVARILAQYGYIEKRGIGRLSELENSK